MKRITTVLALLVALCALLAATAWASDFDHCADALKDLGLFQGTDQGYDLDRAPTRAEAGAMLVRLLGKEAEAKELTYTAPFTDVAAWAQPYVQYLYDNGLTNGMTATTYGYAQRCTAQQYATFLLRALGYSDAADGDFTYATALDFAREKGVVDALNCDEGNFLRDDVAAMSYTALSVAPKSGETDLLTKLVAQGAVADAKGYDQLFADLRTLNTADESTAVSCRLEMALDMKLANVDYLGGKLIMDMAAQMDLQDPDASKMAVKLDADLALTEQAAASMGLTGADTKLQAAMQYYYTDGAMYMEMDGAKVKVPLSLSALIPAGAAAESNASSMVCAVRGVEHTTSGGTDRYTVTYAPSAMDRAVAAVSEQAGVGGYSMGYDAMKMETTLRSGKLQSASLDLSMHAAVEGMVINMRTQGTLSNVKTGDSVRVDLPSDLSTYEELDLGIIGGADGPTSIFTTAG